MQFGIKTELIQGEHIYGSSVLSVFFITVISTDKKYKNIFIYPFTFLFTE
jgi:hypothetical protein